MIKKTQFGRSMIEMLGVLAIIGVLSIGGLAGYSKAMKKIKLNDARVYFNKVKMEIKAREVAGTIVNGQPYRCDALTGEAMPAGMTHCQYQNQWFPGHLFIRFAPGDLLTEFGKQLSAANGTAGAYTDEQLASGSISFSTYRLPSGAWWSEYYLFGGYVN